MAPVVAAVALEAVCEILCLLVIHITYKIPQTQKVINSSLYHRKKCKIF